MNDPHHLAGVLDAWLELPMTRANLADARAAFDALSDQLRKRPDLCDPLAISLLNVFLKTGYVKDYKKLRSFARAVKRPELLEEVEEVLRVELPDVWVVEALQRGDTEEAVDYWFEHEDHPRARHAAPALLKAFPDRVDVVISARLSVATYWINRGARYRYRKAIKVLKTLQKELDALGERPLWHVVMEDVMHQHGHRNALVDEMEKADINTANF